MFFFVSLLFFGYVAFCEYHVSLRGFLMESAWYVFLTDGMLFLFFSNLVTTCWILKSAYYLIFESVWGTLMVGLITEPLGFVQDAQDVMVLFDEWLAVLGLCSVRVLDEPSAGRDACMS